MTARSRRRCASARRFEAATASGRRIFCAVAPVAAGAAWLKSWAHRRSKAFAMSVASKASRPFVPPFPRRPDRPRGVALDHSRPSAQSDRDLVRGGLRTARLSSAAPSLGLRGAAHDPGGRPTHLSRQRRQLPQGRSSASRVAAGSRQWAADRRGRGLAHPAPRAGALVFAPSGRGIRPGHATGRASGGRAHEPAGATAQ